MSLLSIGIIMRWRVQLGINSIRVMFANFAKIGRAAGAS